MVFMLYYIILVHLQSDDPKLTPSAAPLHVRATRTYLSSIRVGEDRQLAWLISSRDSFEQCTDLAGTLWTEFSFPGAVPKGVHQREHNKSPPPDMAIMEPLVGNFIFLVFVPKAYYTAISPKHQSLSKLVGGRCRYSGGSTLVNRVHSTIQHPDLQLELEGKKREKLQGWECKSARERQNAWLKLVAVNGHVCPVKVNMQHKHNFSSLCARWELPDRYAMFIICTASPSMSALLPVVMFTATT